MSESQRALTPIDTGRTSPLVAPAPQRVSYFSPLFPPSPNPSGILLNRSYFDAEVPQPVTAPAEAVPLESPLPPNTKEQSDEHNPDRSRKSRSPSPHCHFAPLPKVAPTERVNSTTTSRRNSAATARAKFLESNPDGQDEQFAIDLSEDGPTPPSINHSAVSATNLSNSLASMQIARPLTPRTHSATRSPSVSPGISRPNSAAGVTAQPIGNGPLFSPPLSRKPSTDGISHHYIEARPVPSRSRSGSMSVGLGVLGRSTSLSKERSASSTGSRGGDSDREGNFSGGEDKVLGFEALRRSESAAWKEERILRGTATPPISSNPGSFLAHPTAVVGNPTTITPIVPSHTLTKSSLAPSTTATPLLASTLASTSQIPVPSPALSTRRTFFVEPAVSSDRPSLASSVSGRCRPPLVSGEGSRRRTGAASNEEVVEVVQEPTQEDPDEADEDELNEDDDDEDDEDDDEEEDDEEESGENGEKVEEEDEEEENVGIGRRTTTGGGVEVVHWHRDEVVEA